MVTDTWIEIPAYGAANWKSSVVNPASLPVTGNTNGDARIDLSTDTIYIWNGTSWIAVATPGAAIALDGLIGDVSASGPGVAVATVNSVGGSSAANINNATILANASTSADTPNTIVKRDGSGNFSASTITATLNGTATNITATSNSTLTTLSALSLPTSQLSGTVSLTTQVSGILPILNGGTGSSTQNFVNLTTNQTIGGLKSFTGQLSITNVSTSALSINTSSFIFDSLNNVLGIGIQPSTSVMIDGINTSGSSKLVQMTGYGTGSTTGYRGRFARGTVGSPSATQAGDNLSAISGRGYGISQFAVASTGIINIVAGETFTDTSNQTYLQFEATPTGSVTAAEHMRVAATGVTLGPQSASTDMHKINGALSGTTRTITSSTFTVDTTTTDYIIYADTTSNSISITLPIPTSGRILVIEGISGTASVNNITILPHTSEKINGASSFIINQNYGSVRLTSDGTNWFVQGTLPNVVSSIPGVIAIPASSIDWSLGNVFTKTLSANTTFTFSNATAGQTIVIRLTNTASNYTVTWPSMKWPVQTAPVMTIGAFSDIYTIIYDGTTYYGSYVQNF